GTPARPDPVLEKAPEQAAPRGQMLSAGRFDRGRHALSWPAVRGRQLRLALGGQRQPEQVPSDGQPAALPHDAPPARHNVGELPGPLTLRCGQMEFTRSVGGSCTHKSLMATCEIAAIGPPRGAKGTMTMTGQASRVAMS